MADRTVILAQFLSCIEWGQKIEPFVTEVHEDKSNQTSANGIAKIHNNDHRLHVLLLFVVMNLTIINAFNLHSIFKKMNRIRDFTYLTDRSLLNLLSYTLKFLLILLYLKTLFHSHNVKLIWHYEQPIHHPKI